MLTNILNTLAITCSLGTSVLNTKPPLPSKNNNTINWGLVNGTNRTINPMYLDIENYQTRYKLNFTNTYYEYNQDGLYIDATCITLNTSISNSQITPITYQTNNVIPKNPNTSMAIPFTRYTDTITSTDIYVPCNQEIWYIRVESTANLINNNWDYTRRIYNFIEEQNTQTYVYTELFNTITTNVHYSSTNEVPLDNFVKFENLTIEDYLDFDDYTIEDVECPTLYGRFEKIKLNTGYTSNINYWGSTEIEYHTPPQPSVQPSYYGYRYDDIGVNYNQNKVNYYILYAQPITERRTGDTQTSRTFLGNYYISTDVGLYGETTQILGTINQEVIDLPNVMFTVLGMPFTFISTAFNLTLFPGTAYEINISILFLAIFGILVFVFLLKLILSKVR